MADRTRIPLPAMPAFFRLRHSRTATALFRGLRNRCPKCGRGTWRVGYLTVAAACRVCGEKLGHIRADDGPAYITVLLVGHIVVPAVLVVERDWHPPLLPDLTVTILITCALVWRLLPRVKGAVVGLMWALGLAGDEIQGDVERHG